ncbi:MAG: hypothetical protein Q9198_007362 [Flavoplaca austrocitrina]
MALRVAPRLDPKAKDKKWWYCIDGDTTQTTNWTDWWLVFRLKKSFFRFGYGITWAAMKVRLGILRLVQLFGCPGGFSLLTRALLHFWDGIPFTTKPDRPRKTVYLTLENLNRLLRFMAQNTSALLALPTDILVLLPYHIANLEDFKELSSTCRQFRAICHSVSPNLILRLAAASSRTFFRPDPYFLVAATAKQIGYWALQNEENAAQLRQALKHGIGRLFDLCVEKAGLSMDDIRR